MRFEDDPLSVLTSGKGKLWMLLVGVNHYEDERLTSLNFAVSDCQGLADALAEATQCFRNKKLLLHCSSSAPITLEAVCSSLQQVVEEAKPQDTVLFYFSGHGLVDPVSRQPFLCLAKTQTDDLRNTGLALQELLQRLKSCNASKQLVLLDACHSGSMVPLWGGARVVEPQPDSTRELAAVLQECAAQSRGFCALLSCDEGQRSWEFPDLQHGIFTYYLMQGLQGEAADERGVIEVKNLYTYVCSQTQQQVDSRIRQSSSHDCRQTPKLIMSLAGDLVLGFRIEADNFLKDYERRLQDYIKKFNIAIQREYPLGQDTRQRLQQLQQGLGLRDEDTCSTEGRIVATYELKLQRYQQEMTAIVRQQYPPNQDTYQQLQQLQQELRLSDSIAVLIGTQVTQAYEQKLQQYQETFTTIIQRQYSLREEDQEFLANLQQVLDLNEETTQPIERQVIWEYEQKLQQYEAAFTKAIYQQYPGENGVRQQLQQLQQSLGLSKEIISSIEAQVTQGYEQKLQQYEAAFTLAIQRQYSLDSNREFWDEMQQVLDPVKTHTQGYKQKLLQYEKTFTIVIHRQYPLGAEARQLLQMLQQNLELKNETIKSIEAQVTQGYEQKLQQYEAAFNQAAQRQYPLSDSDCKRLEYVRQVLNLSQKITDSIEQLENLRRALNLSEEVIDSIEAKVTEAYKTDQLNPPIRTLQGEKHTDNFNLSPSTSALREGKKGKVRHLLVKVTIAAIALTSISVVASHLYDLWQADRFAKADLESTKLQKERKNYEACVSQAKAIPQNSRFFAEAQDLLHQCQYLVQEQKWLAQAKELATKNSFQDAIATASQIQLDSSHGPEVQQLISQWSENLLNQAESQYTRSYNSKDLENAIKLTQVIPSNSVAAQKAEEMTEKWRSEWNRNETFLQEAQNALNQGKWAEATEKASQIRLLGQEVKQETPYWQNKTKPIIERANELRAAKDIRKVESSSQPTTRQSPARPSTTQQPPPPARPSTTRRAPTRSSTVRRAPTRSSAVERAPRSSTARPSTTRRSSTRRTPTQRSAPQRSGSSGWAVEQE